MSFALSGLLEAARKRLDAVGVCVVAGLTAFGGGVLRDIVCNEIPSAFNDHRPYAICAFTGGWVLVCAVIVTAALRGIALLTDFALPRWRGVDDPRDGMRTSTKDGPRKDPQKGN